MQSLWYKLFGFSLLVLRSLSIFWGAVTLLAWYVIASRVSRDRRTALLAAMLIAVDFHFIGVAALGRMDMLCAGLGSASFAVFLILRERALKPALLVSFVLAAGSCLTHPAGVLYFLGLVAIVLYYDRALIGWREIACAAAPYFVALSAWGLYISRNPALFWKQFSGNASGIASEFTTFTRWSGLSNPIKALWNERIRYIADFGWYVGHGFWERFPITILLIYALGIGVAVCTPSIRRHPGYRLLFLLGLISYVTLAEFEGLKSGVYMVHTLPLCAVLLAGVVVHYWSRGNALRRTADVALMVFVVLQLGYNLRFDLFTPLRWDYAAALGFVKQTSTPPAQIIGTADMAFDLGFDSGLIDDPRLGYYSGKRPQLIVGNIIYRGWRVQSATKYPEIHLYIERLLDTEYREVFHNASFTIYQRRSASQMNVEGAIRGTSN
jgi:4-amino-4-deoxy-L-arabinose transferase-like glycosyltransferase